MPCENRTSRKRRGASWSRRTPEARLLRAGLAVGLLRLCFVDVVGLRLGALVGRGVLGGVLLDEVEGLVVGNVGRGVVGGLVGLGEGGGVVRDDRTVGLQVVLDAVHDPVVLVIAQDGADGVLGEEQV